MWPTEADAAKAIIEAKGNKADPVRQTVWALEQFFPQPIALDGLNARRGQQLYDELPRAAARADEEARAPDSHRSMLSHAKTFLEYCIGQRWLRGANPLAEVEGMGKRRPRGKSRGAGERRGLTSDLSGDRLISVTLQAASVDRIFSSGSRNADNAPPVPQPLSRKTTSPTRSARAITV